ncbi:MAG: hypothetical protein AAF322_09250, partial [Pseudomonadota bacterium]
MRRRAVLSGLLATGGCAIAPRLPDVDQLYEYTSEVDPALRRPLITVPGTLGSRLRAGRDGDFVWGGGRRLSVDPRNMDDARRLALPIGKGGEPLSALRDDVRPDGVLRRARAQVLVGTVEQQVYDGLVASLNAGGYEFSATVEEEEARSGQNPGSLEFPYDWRRDIVESARDLDAFIERKAKQVERVRTERYGRSIPADRMRFDFVAHSMGALVVRYWLMYGGADLPEDGSTPELTWAGAKRAACVVFVAPPNFGSATALENLVMGRSFGPLQPFYPPALLGTLPSAYQLMPRDRHRRARLGAWEGEPVSAIYDPDTWERWGWGLLDPGQDATLATLMPDAPDRAARLSRARGHLEKCLARA